MICKKCGKDVSLEGIECPQCGYNHIEEEVIVIKKQVINDEIKVDIDGDGKPDITIKKTRFFKKGYK